MLDLFKESWRILTTPGKELVREWIVEKISWVAVLEFLEVSCLLVAIGVLILYMMGARGRVARCLYWSLALYVVLQILC